MNTRTPVRYYTAGNAKRDVFDLIVSGYIVALTAATIAFAVMP